MAHPSHIHDALASFSLSLIPVNNTGQWTPLDSFFPTICLHPVEIKHVYYIYSLRPVHYSPSTLRLRAAARPPDPRHL